MIWIWTPLANRYCRGRTRLVVEVMGRLLVELSAWEACRTLLARGDHYSFLFDNARFLDLCYD